MKQPPSVGRDVHYVAPGSADGRYPPAHRAAKITEVYDMNHLPPLGERTYTVDEDGDITDVGLIVFNPTGIHFRETVQFDPGKERCSCGEDLGHPVHASMHPDSHDPVDVRIRHRPGTWHWPEFVPARA